MDIMEHPGSYKAQAIKSMEQTKTICNLMSKDAEAAIASVKALPSTSALFAAEMLTILQKLEDLQGELHDCVTKAVHPQPVPRIGKQS